MSKTEEKGGVYAVQRFTHVFPFPFLSIKYVYLSYQFKGYYDNVQLKTLDSLKEKIDTSFTFPKDRDNLFIQSFLSNHISCRLEDYSTTT